MSNWTQDLSTLSTEINLLHVIASVYFTLPQYSHWSDLLLMSSVLSSLSLVVVLPESLDWSPCCCCSALLAATAAACCCLSSAIDCCSIDAKLVGSGGGFQPSVRQTRNFDCYLVIIYWLGYAYCNAKSICKVFHAKYNAKYNAMQLYNAKYWTMQMYNANCNAKSIGYAKS